MPRSRENRWKKSLLSVCFGIETTAKKAVPEWHQKALEWDAEAVTKFHAGVAKGSAAFLDKDGEFVGEGKIKLRNTYEMLLLVWPENEEMLKANPPKLEIICGTG